MSTPEATTDSSLVAQVRGGLAWSLLSNVLGRLATTLSGIWLARLLVPDEYGVFAIGLVVLTGLTSLNEMGASVSVVRWPTDPRPITPTVSTIAVVTSGALYAACFALAPALAAAVDAPGAVWPVRVLALAVLIDAFTCVPGALLTREFMQRERTGADMSNLVVALAVTVGLAAAGAGAWSLVVGRLIGNLLGAAMLVRLAPYRTSFGWDRDVARQVLGTGLPLAGASALTFLVLNLDYVVVGATLGPALLGIYLLAFNASSWPVNMFSTAVRRVSLAGFAAASRGTGVITVVPAAMAMLLGVTLPACALLAALAEPFVVGVYGDRWAPAVAALRALAVLAAARVVVELLYDLLVSLGSSRTVLVLQALWAVCLAPALLLGEHVGGLGGLSVAHAALAVGIIVPGFLLATGRAGIAVRPVLAAALRPVLGAALCYATARLVVAQGLGHWPTLLLGGAAGGLVHLAVCQPLLRQAWTLRRAGAAQTGSIAPLAAAAG